MEVEVVFPEVCGAFYKAFVQDINLSAGTVLLGFEKHWKQDTTVELGHVRFPPVNTVPAVTLFQPGTRVEALLPHLENEPSGWWTGSVLKSKGELHVVEFQSGGEKYQDIVERDKLRIPNDNPPLSKVQFFRKVLPVPDEIQEFCKRPRVHQNFCSKLHAVCVSYDDSRQGLVVIGDSEQCLEKAAVLSDIHFVDLATQMSLLSRNEMVATRMTQQHQRQMDMGTYEIKFLVPGSLVGLAIGKEGGNVNEVRKMDGIIMVEFDDNTSMFTVRAKNKEVLTKAREKLEYVHDTVLIPRNLAGKVIGKKGTIIQSILEKSRVNNVKVVGDDQAKERNIDISAQVPFDIIGRRTAVDNAKLMLDYHIDHLKDLESIIQSRKEMDTQLQANNSYDDAPTYYPRPGEGVPYRGGRGFRRGGRGGGGRYRSDGGRTRYTSRQGDGARSSEQQQQQQQQQSERAPPPAELPAQQQPDHQDETYVSEEEESDSGRSVEEDGEDSNDDRKSPPEDDDQGPDRRRQRGGYRGNRRGWRGGRGGTRGGRGHRGGGRYHGGPRQQPQQQQQQQQGEDSSAGGQNSSSGGHAAEEEESQPRPQETARQDGKEGKRSPDQHNTGDDEPPTQ